MNTTTVITPRVWVGCLACYNAGNLRGEWVDAIEADDVTPEDLHGRATSHDELWCLDTEGMPVAGEMSPADATEWARVLDEVEDCDREALEAWAADQGAETPAEWEELRDRFEDHYRGEWDSVVAYCEDFADSTGMLDGMPEHLRCYFDYEAFARDVAIESCVLDAPGGGVFIFDY